MTYQPPRPSFSNDYIKPLFHPIKFLQYYPKHYYQYIQTKSEWYKSKTEWSSPDIYELTSRLKSNTTRLRLLNPYCWALLQEYKSWEKDYIPNFSIKDKTILDIGAGCGETAYFYFQYGAKKVICIEQDITAFFLLEYNSFHNGWNTELHNKSFDLTDLSIPCDLIKMDIEAAEINLINLLDNQKLPPIILESHSNQITSRLQSEFPELKIKSSHPLYETKILSNCG